MFVKRIIIFANGELPDLEKARALLHDDDFIIAADGGTRHALALGLTPNIIIGDLDSATFDSSTSSEHRLRPSTFALTTASNEFSSAVKNALSKEQAETSSH